MHTQDLAGEVTDGAGGALDAEAVRLRRRLNRQKKARLEAEAISERATRELYRQKQGLQLLQDVAVAANQATTVEQALRAALESVCGHTGWLVGHVYLRDSDSEPVLGSSGIWHLADHVRFESFRVITEKTRFSSGIGLPGRVLATARAHWIEDVTKDSNFPRAKYASDIGVKAGFGAPILVEAEVAGVLEFFTDVAVEPDESLLDLMFHVGTQLGRVIERERAEQGLRSSEANLASAQRVAHLGSWAWDIKANKVSWSAELYRIYGLHPNEFAASYEGFLERVHPDDRARADQTVRAALAAGEPFTFEHRIVRPDGAVRTLQARGEVFIDAAGDPVSMHGIGHDITERKEAGEELRKHRVHLEELVAERTAALSVANKELEAFSYSVSHDLRAPLRSMDGFSQALLEDYAAKLEPEATDFLHRIRESSQHMAQLIDDLLTLARVARSEMRQGTVDLTALAHAVAAELRETDPERRVTFLIEGEMRAHADERLLRVVLENLLGNAWKFTSKHETATIEFGVETSDGVPTYFVRDDGAGFDMAFADKLFGAFQRLHSTADFEGTGVGLATVQRIIHRHGGRVWAEGKEEGGATFHFTLAPGRER